MDANPPALAVGGRLIAIHSSPPLNVGEYLSTPIVQPSFFTPERIEPADWTRGEVQPGEMRPRRWVLGGRQKTRPPPPPRGELLARLKVRLPLPFRGLVLGTRSWGSLVAAGGVARAIRKGVERVWGAGAPSQARCGVFWVAGARFVGSS
jgi:hypothetical protein